MADFEEMKAYAHELCKEMANINQRQIAERNEAIISKIMEKFHVDKETATEAFMQNNQPSGK